MTMTETTIAGIDPDALRPLHWADVMDQPKAVKQMVSQVARARHGEPINRFILLASKGPGVGKTTLANIFAAAVNCHNLGEGYEPCGQCSGCATAFQHNTEFSSVTEVDGASNNSVAAIRDLWSQQMMTSQENWRIVIINEAHRLTQPAQEASLVQLEKPQNSRLIVIMTTTNKSALLKPVQSRAYEVDLDPVSDEAIVDVLRSTAKDMDVSVPDDVLIAIAKKSQGELRTALNILGAELSGGNIDGALRASGALHDMVQAVVVEKDLARYLTLANAAQKDDSIPYMSLLGMIFDALRQQVIDLASSGEPTFACTEALGEVANAYRDLETVSSQKIVVEGVIARIVAGSQRDGKNLERLRIIHESVLDAEDGLNDRLTKLEKLISQS